MVNGTGVRMGWAVAEKLRLSIANPCALPVASHFPDQPQSGSGRPVGDHPLDDTQVGLVYRRSKSTATPPTSAGTVGIFTDSSGSAAVRFIENGAVALGSMR